MNRGRPRRGNTGAALAQREHRRPRPRRAAGRRAAAAAKEKEEARQRARPLADELEGQDFITKCVESLRGGDPTDARRAYQNLMNAVVLELLGKSRRDDLLRELANGVLDDPGGDDAVRRDPALFASLVLADAGLRVAAGTPSRFGQRIAPPGVELAAVGGLGPAVAAAMVRDHWTSMDPGRASAAYQWINQTIPKSTWNDPTSGLAARMFNNLWNLGQTERICDLITLGVDSSLPAAYGKDEGRGSRDGIWSGFVQPLQHLLGNYVKRVADETDPITKRLKDSAPPKVKRAADILALPRHPRRDPDLTNYTDVKRSDLVTAFLQKQGTIWGFEDVPAALRPSRPGDRDFGQQPLRMMEIWEGIKPTLDKAGYEKLITDPEGTIADCITVGVKKIQDEIDANNPEYAGRRKDEFVREFTKQCTDYLRFLARQTPAAVETAELNGKDPGKLMGALACKAGLWWAQNQKWLR